MDEQKRRLMKAIALKDYAISRGFDVPDEILSVLSTADEFIAHPQDLDPHDRIRIDKAISEITKVTYPTTGDSLLTLKDPPQSVRYFRYALPLMLVVALAGAIAGYGYRGANPSVSLSVLALSLGLLGAVIYLIFNVIGVIREKAFTPEDVYANGLRILLGPAVGWLFYFGFSRDAFVRMVTPLPDQPVGGQTDLLLLLLPFLAGFSIKLVVGIMEKVIESVMLVFGIEDKSTAILVRRRRNQETSSAVSEITGGRSTGLTSPHSEPPT